MKPAGWVDTVQWALPFVAGGTTWFVRGRRADARAAVQDAAVTDKTHADAADVISTAAARTVTTIAEQLDRLDATVQEQGKVIDRQGAEIVALRAERDHDTAAVRVLTQYAVEVGGYVRRITARFLELTGQQAPPPPTPPAGLVPDPDAGDDALTIPDAVGGTPSWPTPPPPSPRPAS